MTLKISMIIVYLHYSVSNSSDGCQFQACGTWVIAAILHLVDNDINSIDTVAIVVGIDGPGGTGLHVTDDSGYRVLERSSHVSQDERTVHRGQHCC